MGLSRECSECLYQRQVERLPQEEPKEKREEYMKQVQMIINNAGDEDRAPVVTERISQLHQEFFGSLFSFDELKKQYNTLMMSKEKEIRQVIESSEDPLSTAVLYARTGNYIDFGAMGSVDDEKLDALLRRAQTEELEEEVYQSFCNHLKQAEHVVYLTDNCGEIVMDKLLLEQMNRYNPKCKLSVVVRGTAVLNDATMEDAVMTGIGGIAQVYPNGTGIAGTSLKHVSPAIRDLIMSADLIISKGQGNFETLYGSHLPIFYLFLCKCSWFGKRFGLPMYEGVFVSESDIKFK